MSHQIIHGDCLDVMRQMTPSSFDAVVTDPPYSSGGQYRGDRMASTRLKYVQTGTRRSLPEFSGDNRDQRGYLAWSTLWMSEAKRLTKPGGLIAVFSDWRQVPTTTDAIQCAGWVWRGIAVWVKKTSRPIKGRWNQQAEFVVWGSNGPRGCEGKCAGSAWYESSPQGDGRVHITQKPDAVMEGILSVMNGGDHVLDPFCGSGSTGRAAVALGLNFVGIEMGEDFAAIARERVGERARSARALFPAD